MVAIVFVNRSLLLNEKNDFKLLKLKINAGRHFEYIQRNKERNAWIRSFKRRFFLHNNLYD